jgi:hypothetical protein
MNSCREGCTWTQGCGGGWLGRRETAGTGDHLCVGGGNVLRWRGWIGVARRVMLCRKKRRYLSTDVYPARVRTSVRTQGKATGRRSALHGPS